MLIMLCGVAILVVLAAAAIFGCATRKKQMNEWAACEKYAHYVPEKAPTVAQPLDDAGFFYFIRTTPLELGKTYTFERYFKKATNPVTLRVVKREGCELPDGTKLQCLVLHPVIGSDRNGMFSPRADARIWLTDDARRIPVQIRSKLGFGTVTLKIKSMTGTT